MKNKLLGKATTLVMSFLVLFSGEVLAISSNNNQELSNELSNTNVSHKLELIVAQAILGDPELSIEERIEIAQSLSIAATSLGNATIASRSANIPNTERLAITNLLTDATNSLGDLLTLSQSPNLTQSDAREIDDSIFETFSLISEAASIAESISSSPGALALLESLNLASEDTGNAGAVATSAHGGSGRRYRRR